jgi:nitrogen regulatory protein P-II 1
VREIKAFIRKDKLEETIHALEKIGVTDVAVLEVKEIGSGEGPESERLSVEMTESYARVAKIEIVCKKERALEIVAALREAAYTGRPGDGIVYVTPVEKAVKIRTGLDEI